MFTRCKEIEEHFRKKEPAYEKPRGMNSIGSQEPNQLSIVLPREARAGEKGSGQVTGGLICHHRGLILPCRPREDSMEIGDTIGYGSIIPVKDCFSTSYYITIIIHTEKNEHNELLLTYTFFNVLSGSVYFSSAKFIPIVQPSASSVSRILPILEI